jgi:pyruvate dehydrogenase E2 component (dihydrolipoamide acetyltransferase)
MAQIVTMPKLGFDMAEGTLVRWVIQEGETVAKGAVLAEIETDKATVEVESAYEGIMARHLVHEGESVPVNTPIAVIAAPGEKVEVIERGGMKEVAEAGAEAPLPPAAEPAPAEAVAEGRLPGGVKASPLARRMAEEYGLPLGAIRGSGPGGRITKKDVEAYLAVAPAAAVAMPEVTAPAVAPPAAAAVSVPISRLRATIGRRMAEAKQRVPHFYVTYEYDMAAVMDLRQQVNRLLPEEEKTSVNDYIIKAVALTLREFPNLNASLDEQNNRVLHHAQVNIGVAVAVEGGLLTVVCREADHKPIRQIANEVRVMVQRAREGKVRPEDIEGSTFTVSNLGMYDVEQFAAIINPPEAAILAVGAVKQVPVVKEGQIVPGLRMKATLSVDHRLSDGAEAARFLQALARFLDEPLRLLLQG